MSHIEPSYFKYPSDREVEVGSWTPLFPKYNPFVNIDNFCNSCYTWRLLELLKGAYPRWANLMKIPGASIITDYDSYGKHERIFKKMVVSILRSLTRCNFPQNLHAQINRPADILLYLLNGRQPDDDEERVIHNVCRYLNRLDSLGKLKKKIQNSENILFDLQVNCEKFQIPQGTPIQLRHRPFPNLQSTPPIYQWQKEFALYGIIPILDLEEKELRSVIYIAEDFFDPPIVSNNIPFPLRRLLIVDEFHKLWILREAMAQMCTKGNLTPDILQVNGSKIFTSIKNLHQYDFRTFSIIVDTIDHSFPESYVSNVNFQKMTGQAAICQSLLYGNSPNIVKLYNPDCPFRNTQYFCPLSGTIGCGMQDRRPQTFPRDKSEKNVLKFLRNLRDEEVFLHRLLYLISRKYPNLPFDLNQEGKFWIGYCFKENNQLIFQSNMPSHWLSPQISEKKYEIVFLSPLCYEKGYSIIFDSFNARSELILHPIAENYNYISWQNEEPFLSSGRKNPINCIIGKFSINTETFIIQKQKKALIKSIYFSSISTQNLTPDEILERRLGSNQQRIGESTFGHWARFV